MAGKHSIGWIGMGRMGYPMAERLLKAGNTVSIWNRTRAKAEPLAKLGGRIVDDAGRPCRVRHRVHHGLDRQGPGRGVLRQERRGIARQGQAPEGRRRLLVDLGAGIGRLPREARGARRRLPCLARQRQRQGREGRQAQRRCIGPQGGVRGRQALHPELRSARRFLRRRGRALAHLQDRPQRAAGRRHPEPRRDHHSGPEGRRAASRLPRFHQQQRDGLGVHAATSRMRWSTSTGPPHSRRTCCARTSISASRPRAGSTCRCR